MELYAEFDSIADYVSELQGNPYLAVIPLQQAADALNISRAAVHQRIGARKLDGVKLSKTVYACALSVLAVIDHERELVQTVKSYLEKVAKRGQTTNYAEVMPLVGLSTKIPKDRLIIGRILGTISRQTNSMPKPVLLSALVFNQQRKRPSDAFFDLAHELGYDRAYDEDFLQKHLTKIHRRYE